MTDKGILRLSYRQLIFVFYYMSRFFSYAVAWRWKFLVVLWRGGAPLASRTAQMPIIIEAGGCHGRRTPLRLRRSREGHEGTVCRNIWDHMGRPERVNNTLKSGGFSNSALANSCYSGGWQGADEGNWDGCGTDPWQVWGAFTFNYNPTLPHFLCPCPSVRLSVQSENTDFLIE